METITGTSNRILEIDITKRTFTEIKITKETRKKYMGGKGLALKLLYDRLTPGIDPLGEDNIFIVTTGVFIGTGAPNSARFSAVTKSPLTGIITSSSCGGPFGEALKTSGWDGIIVRGKSENPVYLKIDPEGVKFKDGIYLWGKTTVEAEKLLKEEGGGSLLIGPAGENLVRFANIYSEERFLGRGGMGAVLGSKKIKGIVAEGGKFSISPKRKPEFRKISARGFKYIKQNHITSKLYRNYGTAMYTKSNNEAGILPVKNFSKGGSSEAYRISGEYIKEKFDTTFSSCKYCSILCGHKGKFKDGELRVPEYETLSLLGSNLGIFDPDSIATLNEVCTLMGIDTMSAGGTLAWVMEASEKRLIKYDLQFGDSEKVKETLYNIAYLRGFGREIADGSRNLAKKYGGKEFSIEVKGLEMGGYDPRGSLGMGLNYAVANRGACHLSSSIFGLEISTGLLNPGSVKGKHIIVKYFEDLFSAINSLHTCQFTTYAYLLETPLIKFTPFPILKFFMRNFPALAIKFLDVSIYSGLWSSITGIKLSNSELLKAGERTHILERFMNTNEGIRKEDDTLPAKILVNGRENIQGDKPVPLEKMLKRYYRKRGYDKNGIPTEKKLKKLGIMIIQQG